MPASLDTATHRRLLSQLNLGSSVAEHDSLLSDARIETPTFSELLDDRIDLIRGTKGSGKTALFRIFVDHLDDLMLHDRRVILVPGVESVRDPVFMRYRGHLETLDELSFENFWRMYFICVINNHLFLIEDRATHKALDRAKGELHAYKDACLTHGYPTPKGFTPSTVIRWALGAIPRPKIQNVKVGLGIDVSSGSPQATLEFERSGPPEGDAAAARVPVFIQEVHDALIAVLEKADLAIWVMLDRLDEIFARRSDIERTALRALLRTVTSFASPRLRLKIFLRDDIFESVTETGFVNLTHLLSRASDTMRWNREQLLHLLVRRIFSDHTLRRFYRVDVEHLKTDPAYREDMFAEVLPKKIHAGKNQSRTMDWLMKHCEDGNGVVTPRDLIELLTSAAREQREMLTRGGGDFPSLLTAGSIRVGYTRMCEQKKISYLKAEFPHFWPDLEAFEGRKAEQTEQSLKRLLGPGWRDTVKNLRAIGFLHFNARARTYMVPYLYRQCLGIRQGRETGGSGAV